jgi:hypothetical protein
LNVGSDENFNPSPNRILDFCGHQEKIAAGCLGPSLVALPHFLLLAVVGFLGLSQGKSVNHI